MSPNIDKKNKEKIALFLGWFREDGDTEAWYKKTENSIVVAAVDDRYENNFWNPEGNWNQLMLVTDKIDTILFKNIGKLGYNDECLHSRDIEVAYQAVLEFIDWYSENNK